MQLERKHNTQALEPVFQARYEEVCLNLKSRIVFATLCLMASVPVFAGTIHHNTCKLDLDDDILTRFFRSKLDGYEFLTNKGYRVITSGAEGEDRIIFGFPSDDGGLRIKEGNCNPAKEDTQCFLAQIPMAFLKGLDEYNVPVDVQTQFQSLIPNCLIDQEAARPRFDK